MTTPDHIHQATSCTVDAAYHAIQARADLDAGRVNGDRDPVARALDGIIRDLGLIEMRLENAARGLVAEPVTTARL